VNLRCCPACARRAGGLVPPECPVCGGLGVLELGRAALARYGPQVTARAVEISLESAARFALADAGMTVESCRKALIAGVARLRAAGVLAGDTVGLRPLVPAQWEPVDESVTRTLDAPALQWAVDDRPVAAAAVGFSAAGYISRLARAADPLDLMGPSTTQTATSRQAVDRAATQLAAAAASFT
jgi:hypothetical protein